MYRGLTRLGYARISHGGLSDTEVQMAKFRIPKEGEKYQDNTKMTTDDRKVPQWQRFPERFAASDLIEILFQFINRPVSNF